MDTPTKVVESSGRPKPPRAGMGRPKGVPNKNTREIKAALQEAFEKLGGVAALVTWGMDNPTPFYQLWSKMAPIKVEHAGEDGGPIQHDMSLTVTFVKPED